MGCFGINGSISKLPITYGNECVLFIGLINKKINYNVLSFGCYNLFTPISLPIYGRYNDYGVINKIIKDKNVSEIEKFFSCDIDTIIKAIDDNMCGRNIDDKELYNKLKNSLSLSVNEDNDDYDLAISIEHKFIYDSISKLDIDINFDLNKSLEKNKELPKTIKEFHENRQVDYFTVKDEIKEYYNNNHKIININPNFKLGIYDFFHYYNNNFLMFLYRNDTVNLLLNEFSDEYIKFLNAFLKMDKMSMNFLIHSYSGQEGFYHLLKLKDYYQSIVDFIKEEEKNN